MPDQGGLAGANLARDHGKAGIIHDAKFEHRERHAVHAAPVKQIGIGQYGKRLLLEPVKSFVHSHSSQARWPLVRPILSKYLPQKEKKHSVCLPLTLKSNQDYSALGGAF